MVPERLVLLSFPITVIGRSVVIDPLCVDVLTLAEKFWGALNVIEPLCVCKDTSQTGGAASE